MTTLSSRMDIRSNAWPQGDGEPKRVLWGPRRSGGIPRLRRSAWTPATRLTPEVCVPPDIAVGNVPDEPGWISGASEKVTLTNLLQRQGYQDLEAVRAEGRKEGCEGLRNALRSILSHRGFVVDAQAEVRIQACTQIDMLNTWLRQALTAPDLPSVFEPTPPQS